MITLVGISALLGLLLVRPLGAQATQAPGFSAAGAHPAASARRAVPFGVGERLDYDVKFGAIKVGNGRMEVVGTADVRGRETWHTRFTVKGGTPFYRVNDRYESWIDTRTLSSLRFVRDLEEGGKDREHHFEIFPDLGTFIEQKKADTSATVPEPLDDAAFLYFLRTVPLEVGKTYSFDRYFRPDRNPVTIKVVRKERVKVPAGTFETVVVQPIIKTKGLFSEKGKAEVWLTDDDRRLLVQLKSSLPIGSINLHLRSVTGTQ